MDFISVYEAKGYYGLGVAALIDLVLKNNAGKAHIDVVRTTALRSPEAKEIFQWMLETGILKIGKKVFVIDEALAIAAKSKKKAAVAQSTDSSGLHKKCIDIWAKWYEGKARRPAKIDGFTGKQMKEIIDYLKRYKESQAEEASSEVIEKVWSEFLEMWDLLDDFWKKFYELHQINKHMPRLIGMMIERMDNRQSALSLMDNEEFWKTA